MEKRRKFRDGAAILLNLILAFLVLYANFMMRHVPFKDLAVFYTEDSNLIAMAASLVMAAALILRWRSGQPVPRWVRLFRYIATCLVAETFFTVVFILTPMVGVEHWKYMLMEGTSLYLHFLCPLLAMFLLIFLEKKPFLPWTSALWALLPTFVYGLILALLNILRIVDGPYPFLRVYEQSVPMSIFWAFFMQLGAFLLAYILWALNRLTGRRSRKKEETNG